MKINDGKMEQLSKIMLPVKEEKIDMSLMGEETTSFESIEEGVEGVEGINESHESREMNLNTNVNTNSNANSNSELGKTQNREMKISNVYMGNLKKEIQEFVDVSKDFKVSNNKVIINLRPVELGNLEIVFVKNKEFINIQIQVENSKALDSVGEVLDEIKGNLEGKEIKVEVNVKEKEMEGERQEERRNNDEKNREEKGKHNTKGEKLNQFEDLVNEMLGEMK